MKSKTALAAWLATAALFAAAAWAAFHLYEREAHAPWTRDGLVQADLVRIASPVSGVVEEVFAASGREVAEGGVLFTVRKVETEQELDLREARERSVAGMEALPRVAGKTAEVAAPADGYVMECPLQRGTVVRAGEPLFVLAVRDSFRVTGFFRETLIRGIREGDRAEVTLMAYPDRPLPGIVESVARGIGRSDGAIGPDMLPQVRPTFDWIRLAQRFPVRIRLTEVPPDVELRIGFTASVRCITSRQP